VGDGGKVGGIRVRIRDADGGGIYNIGHSLGKVYLDKDLASGYSLGEVRPKTEVYPGWSRGKASRSQKNFPV